MILVQLTDLHVRAPGQRVNGHVDTNTMARRAVAAVNKLKPLPDVILLTGDLTDCGLPEEYAHLREILAPLNAIPQFVIPGNHDRREPLRRAFADHDYLPRTGPLCYCRDDWPLRLIGLDSVVEGQVWGELDRAQLAWLVDLLHQNDERPTLIFLHHPPFRVGMGMDAIYCQNGPELERELAQFSSIERVICGHHHRAIFRRFAHTIGSVGPSTAHQVALNLRDDHNQLSLEPPGFHVHLWRPDLGFVTHQQLVGDFGPPEDFRPDPQSPAPPP